MCALEINPKYFKCEKKNVDQILTELNQDLEIIER